MAESKIIDPDGRGISRGGILGNSEAKAYYDQYKTWKASRRSKSSHLGEQKGGTAPRRIDPHRDLHRARNRLIRRTKDELVARVLELEQGLGIEEERWIRMNDRLLEWQVRTHKAEERVKQLRTSLEAKISQVLELEKELHQVRTSDL